MYVNFPGTCEEAMSFYEKHLGAKLLYKKKFSDMRGDPHNMPPGLRRDGILHARFSLGDALILASDGPPERVQPMRSAYLSVRVESDEEAERIYGALKEGGEVFMPIGETFFASRFAQFRDKFGVNWMVLHEKPMDNQ